MKYDPINEQLILLVSAGRMSVKELARGVGLAVSSVHDRLKGLRDEGMIIWTENEHRSYRLTKLGERYIKKHYG